MKRLIRFLIPPPEWRLPVILLLGILGGLGIFVLYISNAVSYLSDDPRACVNCHVMTPQYATWERGSLGRVTSCNDCHVPQDNI
ncbi:MAG: NapC/NirT family cytochrome c, partial [Bacteroidetes bacterium]|nr:NapC/NirT family cytochrome c [Bacteroidota bacterium]